MHHFLFSSRLADGREVRIAPISLDTYESNQVHTLGDDTGYFIYEFDEACPAEGIEVLGKAASYDAAMRLVDFMQAVPGTI